MNSTIIKLKIVIALAVIFIQIPAEAQRHQGRQRIEAFKVAYLTEKLNLTPEEAQKFWPLYNEFHRKEDSLRRIEHKTMCGYSPDLSKMTDKEVEAFIDQRIIHMQQMTDLKKEYHVKFKSVLPIKKVAQYYIAEREFKKYLLKQLKDKPGIPNHPDGPPPHFEDF